MRSIVMWEKIYQPSRISLMAKYVFQVLALTTEHQPEGFPRSPRHIMRSLRGVSPSRSRGNSCSCEVYVRPPTRRGLP